MVAGNPLQKVLRPYHDETAHQVNISLLIRYTLGLPVSTAVIGVADVAQLTANIAVVARGGFMGDSERQELEQLLG